MKTKITFILVLVISILSVNAQYEYDSSVENPYGKLNPNAPKQTSDYAPMIGLCDCKSQARKQDGNWSKPVDMTWKFKYIMNGMAVQDETLKKDGRHTGSIRQFSKDSSRWYVHYYTSNKIPAKLSVWEGNKIENGNIVLYKDQKAPNGTEGDYRLTFYNISDKGFDWIGEWIDKSRNVIFPTWKISCIKRE
ncbi:hypothetical protein [Urechidicola croceus]|uniref:Uncharacterized protein n=1 Tax=Urechidicola croceus TaxID=1850246 RepID=A0A1D8P3Z3_9FLAO|nr:hypothetical protein [Urechidicola croceus]AOW19288.1 hypothetical protein LPB138_00685 [Urechidicola croceus]